MMSLIMCHAGFSVTRPKVTFDLVPPKCRVTARGWEVQVQAGLHEFRMRRNLVREIP